MAFNGAEPIDPATLDRFAKAFAPSGFLREAFYPCYGLAEATLMVSGGQKLRSPITGRPNEDPAHNPRNEFVSCGFARDDGEILIVDPATRRRCPQGTIGEIWISGSSVAQGYWKRAEETAHCFGASLDEPGERAAESASQAPDGRGNKARTYLRTGDLGFLRDRELFVTGRIKDLINIRGVKHYPQDIERTVQDSHPALQSAGVAAFAIEANGQERLVICQELQRSRRDADPKEVISAIRNAVSQHHELDIFSILLLKPGQLPKTSSGKVQHFACREAFLSGTFEEIFRWTAACATQAAELEDDSLPLQEWMTMHLAASLGVTPDEIDPTEPFARYGLDSLKAASLAADIARHVGREIPLTLFWDYPSITALVEHLEPPGAQAA
jgi:acyl-CoA synthetase (AMP-forming)/AMP-acid ligase II/acyl carrier protein